MMSSLDAVLAQYEKNKQSSSTPRMSQEERLKQYLSLALPKGVKSGERRIRILPTKDGSSPFQEVYFHNTQVQGKWMKIYDPGKDSTGKPTGERSPLNEVEEALRLAGDEQSKELARQYRSQKFYIVKVIDRDAEEDGVKFWRFKHNWKGDGPIDKIIPIWTTISSVMYEDPGKLSENETQSKEWLSNDSTWKDVYSQKPVEYLEAIAKGVEPIWDNELKKYTYNDPSNKTESTTTVGGSNSTFVDPQANDKQDEDLPF